MERCTLWHPLTVTFSSGTDTTGTSGGRTTLWWVVAITLFGLVFDGHPDLRRMYLPEDFEYFPLRKEFPLLGIPGSLPLPGNTPGGALSLDPFPAAHGDPTPPSFDEPAV